MPEKCTSWISLPRESFCLNAFSCRPFLSDIDLVNSALSASNSALVSSRSFTACTRSTVRMSFPILLLMRACVFVFGMLVASEIDMKTEKQKNASLRHLSYFSLVTIFVQCMCYICEGRPEFTCSAMLSHTKPWFHTPVYPPQNRDTGTNSSKRRYAGKAVCFYVVKRTRIKFT